MIQVAEKSMIPGIRENWRVCFTLDDPRYDFSDPRKILDHEKGNYAYLTSIQRMN